MKERPILFKGAMVRAILAGTKTQTRRLVKAEHLRTSVEPHKVLECLPERFMEDAATLCPHGVVGDRLWVKETAWYDVREPQELVIYDATPEWHQYKRRGTVEKSDPQITTPYLEAHEFWKRRPSIFMRRWMSRITLELTTIRIERLNDISEADAQAEGAVERFWPSERLQLGKFRNYRAGYASLWESINGAGSWNANPWVWVISFERV